MSDDVAWLARIRIGAGDVSWRRELGAEVLQFYRSRRLTKLRQSKSSMMELRLDEIADVRMTSVGERYMLAITPKPDRAAELAEIGWLPEDLTVVADPRPNREIERGVMVVQFRALITDLGLMKAAPASLKGLNGAMTLSDNTLTLTPTDGAHGLPELADCVYSLNDIVDVYLYGDGALLFLQVFDQVAIETLLGGEVRYAFDRALLLDHGQWPEAAPFYEQLPRFGDRRADDLRTPDDETLARALNLWVSQHSNKEASQDSSLIDQLDRLNKLRTEGVLSQDEFEAAKARLLS